MKKIFIIFVICEIFLQAQKPNHLLGQTSPYLKQHLYNPVNWYPWNKIALKKVKKEHKLIFLSIGYSTCHWCQVMEKESFSNKKLATILNKYYISIKVDEEEMPTIDKKYQNLYQKIYHKPGGWPLTVILNQNLKPIFIAKYVPLEAAYGSKGLMNIALHFGKLYKNHKAIEILKSKYKNKFYHLQKYNNISKIYLNNILKEYDRRYKGFGKKAKYPHPSTLELLFDIYKTSKNKEALKIFLDTLKTMQKSSLYDQISGGFFRYTIDREWKSPHFEKMLYSNALLLPLYVKAYEMTKNHNFKNLVIKTVKEFDTRFIYKNGLYFSASDANSENMEGGYYLFIYKNTLKELIKNGISKKNAIDSLHHLDITEDGNYDSVYALPYLRDDKAPKNFDKIMKILQKIRNKRKFPFVDKKLILSWNSMMIKAKIEASKIDPKYKKEALRSLKSLIKLFQKDNGDLYHQTLSGLKPKQKGVLEDYAYFCSALLEAYEKSFDVKFLENANKVAKLAIKKFYKKGQWYLSENHEVKADSNDNYYTSSMSVMVENLLKLAVLESSLKYQIIAKNSIKQFLPIAVIHPIKNAKILDDFIKQKTGIITIKSSKANLIRYKKEISKINYPFLLQKAIKIDNFLSCDDRSCFGYGDFDSVKRKIRQRGI